MNRPKIENSLTRRMYTDQLERYCDELEKRERPKRICKKIISNGKRQLYLWYCPNCENWLTPSHDERYCSKCGQRLEYVDD